MKSSEALKLALPVIQEDEESYLCIALEFVGAKYTNVYKNLKEVFPNTNDTANKWLNGCCQGYRDVYEAYLMTYGDPSVYYDLMTEYRVNWINWLIPQYEAVGD